jgi:2-hydroxy-3-oxopropionate reductase
METIGFVGLGAMGAPMAANLLAAGYPLSVWNRTPERAAPLVSLGARHAASARELADCDVLMTMVSDGPDVEAVARAEDGLFAGAREGSLWIDFSSIAPATAVALADRSRAVGIEPVDAPVSGGTKGAASGTLSIMVGGSDEGVSRALPFLEILGENVTHVGPNGAGQVAKLVNQLIVGGTIALVGEGLALAEAAGCSPAAVRAALAGGFADSRVLQIHGQRMLDEDFEPGFRSALQLKDLRNAVDAASAGGLPVPLAALVQQLYAALCATGAGDRDHSSVAQLQRRLGGLETGAS